jgi:glycerol-3-phosphate O-acyltransferase
LIRRPRINGIEHVHDIAGDTPIIVSCVHKSHLDYLLVGETIYQSLRSLPAMIAGKNLFHGLFRYLLPRLKAVCLDRVRTSPKNLRSRDNLLYLTTFYKYLMEEVIARGDIITIFPEAGRSYNGRLLPLSLGVFGIAKRALQAGAPRVALVPVAVSYDRVTEDMRFGGLSQIKTQSRRAYRRHDVAGFYEHALLQPRSDTYVDFGRPLYIEDIRSMDDLEITLRQRMGALVRVSACSLVARALRSETRVPVGELLERMRADQELLRANRVLLCDSAAGDCSTVLSAALQHLAQPRRRRNIIALVGPPRRRSVCVRNPNVIAYYANTIEHFFAPMQAGSTRDEE